jgi:hypothetical protein
MTPDELAGAARNLADGLGIPLYIRDGRIYQHGPGVEFLPRESSCPTPLGAPYSREKSAVARPEERKFLGFSISNDGSERVALH